MYLPVPAVCMGTGIGWDGIFGYLTSHEAYCLCVGNHSGHNLYTRGWGDMTWRASPTWIWTQYHRFKRLTMLPTELMRLVLGHWDWCWTQFQVSWGQLLNPGTLPIAQAVASICIISKGHTMGPSVWGHVRPQKISFLVPLFSITV